MKAEELIRRANEFFKTEPVTDRGISSSKKKVFGFCQDNGISIDDSAVGVRDFPKTAYADELERYPLLKDN